jgi:hypothetical protein
MKMKSVLALSCMFPMLALCCDKPGEKPAFPDVNTAVAAQMIKAHADVKSYVKSVEDYLACSNLSLVDKERRIEDLKKYADDFNKLIAEFKANRAKGA